MNNNLIYDSDELELIISYELKLPRRIRKMCQYLEGKLTQNSVILENLGVQHILEKLQSLEETSNKNYSYSLIIYKDTKLFLRRYQNHFTFVSITKGKYNLNTSAFTLFLGQEKMNDGEWDTLFDNPFQFVSEELPHIFDSITNNGGVRQASFKIKRMEFEVAFCRETLISYDLISFVAEEFSRFWLEKFSENEMLDKIKTLKVGDMVGDQKIQEVKTVVENDYYHSAGLVINDMWADVYTLTRYHYDRLFGE